VGGGKNDWNHKKLHGQYMINFGQNNNGHATIKVPIGFDTLWVRVLGDRWTVLQVNGADRWCGGHRNTNCYCPDGSLSDGHDNMHQWVPIPISKNRTQYLSINNDKTSGSNDFWLSGLAFSKNPWHHATQSAAGYAWAVNGGDRVENGFSEGWNNDVMGRLINNSIYVLKVPVIPSGRDKLLYLIEHNSNWNGCMHRSIIINGTTIKERFLATYDNPFARHWNSKFYNRYIAARIPAKFIGPNAKFIDVVIDMTDQNNHIHFREIGTHDLDVPDVI
jgi:hypothetical protein